MYLTADIWILLQPCFVVRIGAYGAYGAGWGQADGGYGSRKSLAAF